MRRFLHRLAIHVYGVHSPELIPHPITPQQLVEALAYNQLEPWGPERDGWHAAQIATACLQPWAKNRLNIKDYVLRFGGKDKPKSLREKVKDLAVRLGARFKKKDEGAS